MYKTIILLCALVLLATFVAADGSKTVDSYADHQKYCYRKCKKYETVKGKCSDYEWVGTKRECCAHKLVGVGKCLKYKRFSKCDKYSKARTLCLGHGYKQVCDKYQNEKYCTKYGWKNACVGHGKNHHCKEYAYHFICTKYDRKNICASYINVPKVDYYYKQRCSQYKVRAKCAAYKKVCKCQKKWKKVKGTHYKGWTDSYYHGFCVQKCHSICSKYVKSRYCVAHKKVKFSRNKGYTRKCNKFISRKFCVAQKKARFCTKWAKTQFCNSRKRVRVCKQHKTRRFCAKYKAVNFCTQHKNVKAQCIKRKHWRKCILKSKGVKVCSKYQFVGGKKQCAKYGEVTKCKEHETVCTPISIDKYIPKKK